MTPLYIIIAGVAAFLFIAASMLFTKPFRNSFFYVYVVVVLVFFSALPYLVEMDRGYAKQGFFGLDKNWMLLSYYDQTYTQTLTLTVFEKDTRRVRLVEVPRPMYKQTKESLQGMKGSLSKGVPVEGQVQKGTANGTNADQKGGELKFKIIKPTEVIPKDGRAETFNEIGKSLGAIQKAITQQ